METPGASAASSRPLRVATVDDRAPVIATVITAFARDPGFRFFFDGDEFDRQATAFVGYLFDKRVGYGTIWVSPDSEAVALWSPPHAVSQANADRDAQLRVALSAAVGDDVTRRLDAYDALVDAALPSPPEFWYLGILATHPACAGRGWGRALLDIGVAHAHTHAHTHAHPHAGDAYLETTNRANVGYYEANGWSLVDAVATETPSTIFVLRADRRPR